MNSGKERTSLKGEMKGFPSQQKEERPRITVVPSNISLVCGSVATETGTQEGRGEQGWGLGNLSVPLS